MPCIDVDRIADFHARVLGMRKVPNPDGKRGAPHFGRQTINLYPAGRVELVQGPIAREGAIGPLISVCFRDPNDKLVEISNYG